MTSVSEPGGVAATADIVSMMILTSEVEGCNVHTANASEETHLRSLGWRSKQKEIHILLTLLWASKAENE